jgi:hypothetical protein
MEYTIKDEQAPVEELVELSIIRLGESIILAGRLEAGPNKGTWQIATIDPKYKTVQINKSGAGRVGLKALLEGY